MKKIISLTLMAITAFVMAVSISSCCKDDPVMVQSITLDKSEMALAPGSSAAIKATVLPTNADKPQLLWTSSNESVATVDQNGNVTAVGAGTATITAAATDGTSLSATCTVNVPSVTLDPVTLSLVPNGTATITATVVPSTVTLTWTSSNENVAEVDQSGKVTAVADGTATITATTTDGTGINATCVVTIAPQGDPGTGITPGGTTEDSGFGTVDAKPNTAHF